MSIMQRVLSIFLPYWELEAKRGRRVDGVLTFYDVHAFKEAAGTVAD